MLGHGMLMVGGGGLPRITFDSAAKVAGYSIRAQSPTVSYDATNVGMSISGDTVLSFVAFDAFGGFSRDVAFEATVKFVSDSANRHHFGLFCDSGASGVNGYRVCTLDSHGTLSKFVGTTETAFTLTVNNPITPAVGSTYKLRAEFRTNGQIDYLIDGALISRASDASYNTLRPGFFVYGCNILVKDLAVLAL